MKYAVIDSHIHLDMYLKQEQLDLLKDLEKHQIEAIISVSNHLASARKNLNLAIIDQRVKPAFGFHPEQTPLSDMELNDLLNFIKEHSKQMVAIGEVGLPYYLRKKNGRIPLLPYLKILEAFIQQASLLKKPIILHAIYEDAPLVCDLLEKYSIKAAHFHWFKGSIRTIERIVKNGYYISITPDCVYEQEIQQLIKQVPLSQMMVETDGPWPFAGPFSNMRTHPRMIHQVIAVIATLKQMTQEDVYFQIYQNTKNFYHL